MMIRKDLFLFLTTAVLLAWAGTSEAVVACTPLPTGLTVTTVFTNPAAAKTALANGGTIAYQRKYVNASAAAIPITIATCFSVERDDGTTPYFCIPKTKQSIGAGKTVIFNDTITMPSGGKSLVISQGIGSDNAACGSSDARLSYEFPSSGDAIQVVGYTPNTPVYVQGIVCGNLGTAGCQGTNIPGPPTCWQHSQKFTCTLTRNELDQWGAQNCDASAPFKSTIPWTGRCAGPTQDGLIVAPAQALMSGGGAASPDEGIEWIVIEPEGAF